MFKRIMALAAALAMALTLAACKTGGNTPQSTGKADLNGKAYTQQAFDGAMTDGLLAPQVNVAGELVTANQETGKPVVVTTWDAAGKKKSSVTTDVTETATQFSLGAKDEVYLLTAPTGGLQTVLVLDASGKTAKKIELEGMQVRQPRMRNSNGSASQGSSTETTATPAPNATATPEATAKQGNLSNSQGNNDFAANMRSQVSAMKAAPDGGVFVAAMGSGVLQFDANGKKVRALGAESIMSYMAMNESNQLLVYSMGGGMGQGGGAATLKAFDTTNGTELSSVDVSGVGNIQTLFYDKAGKRLLYMTDAEIKILGADGKSGSTLAAFSDFSLLDGSRQIRSFAVDGQGVIYLTANNSSASTGSGTGGATAGAAGGGPSFSFGGPDGGGMMVSIGGGSSANEVIRLGLVDASSIKARKVITMAALNSNRVLSQAISAFQIANPDYKIELKVYNTQVQGFRRGGGQFDNSSLIQALNTDLMSGKGADIIVLDGLPWYKYADKGLLVDMAQVMADKQFDTSQYYGNIFDASKINGKLWGIPMSFSYSVLTGKKSMMPASSEPTIAEFLAKAKALPQGTNPFANQDAMRIFTNWMQYSYSDLVDTQNHKAKFDSPEFIQTMKDFKDLIGENTSTDNNQDFQAMQLDGSVAYNVESMSNPMGLATQRAILGDDLVYTNVPTLSGSGTGAFSSSLMMGINAQTKNKDAAWEFIKSMLGTDIQGSGRLNGYPVLKSATEKMIADMKSGDSLNARGRRMVLRMGDKEIEVKPLTEADYKGITDTLPTLNKLQAIDPNVLKVLTEELPTFFSGQKTAEEVAGLIQNRVNTILNE